VDYRADPDIEDIGDAGDAGDAGVFSIPAGLGFVENARLELFLRRDLILEGCYSRGQQPSDAELRRSADVAMAVYDRRTKLLSLGWQKFAVLQAGLAGIDLDSSEIMEWAYEICKGNDGWLGAFEIEGEREMPLLTMVQEMPVAMIMSFRN